MVAPNLRILPSFNAVGAGDTATLTVPRGPTYRQIMLYYTPGGTAANEATMKSDITEIRVKINGVIQRILSATQLLEIAKIYGISVTNGIIPIFFAEPWRRNADGEDILAWGTQDIQTFQIEVDIDGGATSPQLKAYADISDQKRNLGVIKKNRRYNVGVTATGDRQYNELPKGPSYYALHLFEDTAGDITHVEVATNQMPRFDAPAAIAGAVYGYQELTSQSGIYSVIFDRTRRVADVLPTLQNGAPISDLMLTATMGAANNFTIVTEELGERF